jgi:hypothetical protein
LTFCIDEKRRDRIKTERKRGTRMKKKQLTIMLGAMTLALLLGTAPVVQNVAAAGLPVSISQKAKQDALDRYNARQ